MILLMTGDSTTPPISLGQFSEEGLRPHCHSLLIEELDILILQTELLLKTLLGLKSVKEGEKDELYSFLRLRLGEVYEYRKDAK